MRVENKLTDCGFLDLKKVVDPEKNVRGYIYAERKGVDSVAFVCYDPNSKRFMLNNEYKPPIDEFITGAFGGSIEPGIQPLDIVIKETKEEAGFIVGKEDVKYLGMAFVSTQMNQFCHLFLVLVDGSKSQEREPENAIEAMAKTLWIDEGDFRHLFDWKAQTILYRVKAKDII